MVTRAAAAFLLVALGSVFAFKPAAENRTADSVADVAPAAGPATVPILAAASRVAEEAGAAPVQKATLSVPSDPIEAAEPKPVTVERPVTAKSGDTFMKLLRRAGAGRTEAHNAIAAMRPVFNPRRLKTGQLVTVMFLAASDGGRGKSLLAFTFEDGAERVIWVGRGSAGGFNATVLNRKLTKRHTRSAATISLSLYRAGTRAGLTPATLAELIRLYSWDVDFQRDIQPGDSFDVMVEKFFNGDGALVRTGAIVYAELVLSGVIHRLYRFQTGKSRFGYFDGKGRSARKALMKTPVDGARLSSRFGRRRHPILRYNAMHRGIDFSAPRNTPIYAAGNGTVTYRGRKGAYGRYIRIRHNSRYNTAYGHLRRYAKGLRRGSRVRQGQVIGYVGSSGRSTGPHLHYEIMVNGRRVNPLKVRLPSGRKLAGQALVRFQRTRTAIDTRLAGLKPATKITRR